MTAHELSKEMTNLEANNVLAYWDNKDDARFLTAKQLMRLGDSKTLAVATLMLQKQNESSEMYELAYCS